MFFNKPAEPTANLIDQAALSANEAVKTLQLEGQQALDGLSDAVQHLHDETVPRIDRLQSSAHQLKERSLAAVRDGAQQLRRQAERASNGTTSYIQQEPVKAMLMAAAAGAALVALASLLTRAAPRS
jgi:ElaB/YqjD/DUF883 family membrane-anchored ribosome-binding protein